MEQHFFCKMLLVSNINIFCDEIYYFEYDVIEERTGN